MSAGASAGPIRVCFVCLGNICRSPTAEGVARHLIDARGIEGVEVWSAGTGGWHVGNPPDDRATQTAARRGIVLAGAAHQFVVDDFARADLVVAMDASNRNDLQRMATWVEDPPPVRLLREWDPAAAASDRDVPDPYYGGDGGFDEVLDIVTRSVDALLDDLVAGRAP